MGFIFYFTDRQLYCPQIGVGKQAKEVGDEDVKAAHIRQ